MSFLYCSNSVDGERRESEEVRVDYQQMFDSHWVGHKVASLAFFGAKFEHNHSVFPDDIFQYEAVFL